MKNSIFISHSSRDKEIVSIFAGLIKRITMNQINIWYSNDTRRGGGFAAGDNWFETILNNLKNSKVVISFITENSNDKPWILYESGYAEALENTLLVPVKFMVNINNISVPLQQKQIFSFSDMNEINIFLQKVLAVFDMEYDEEAYRDIVLKCLEEMRRKYNSPQQTAEYVENGNYVIELGEKIDNLLNYTYANIDQRIFNYEVPVEYEIDKMTRTEFIRIDSKLTVSDILDEIYFLLYGKVLPYTYMSSWVLREKRTNRYAFISSVQDWIPANYIFKPETTWEVIYILNDNFLNEILKQEREGTIKW